MHEGTQRHPDRQPETKTIALRSPGAEAGGSKDKAGFAGESPKITCDSKSCACATTPILSKTTWQRRGGSTADVPLCVIMALL
jgi:hypothetical protein